jgi:hypothetical protein
VKDPLAHQEGGLVPPPAVVVALFLGERVDPDDPASLLGLEGPGPWSDSRVIEALQARLRQLGAHPQRASREADELRMWLHAGVSRLLTSDRSAGAASSSGLPEDFESHVLVLVAAAGGWSREVMRQVAALGAERGIDPRQVASWLSGRQPTLMPGRESTLPASVAGRTSVMDPEPAAVDPSRGVVILIGWILGGLLGLLGVAAVVVVVVSMRPPSPMPQTAATSSEQSAGERPIVVAASETGADRSTLSPGPTLVGASAQAVESSSPPQASPASNEASAVHVPEWADLVRDMEGAVQSIRAGEASGVGAFSRAYDAMARAWPSAAVDQRVRAVDGVIDAVYASASLGQGGAGVLDTIAAHAARGGDPPEAAALVAGVWTAGVVARISRERDLPRGMIRRIEGLTSMVFGPGGVGEATFDHGVSVRLRAVAASMAMHKATGDPTVIEGRVDAWTKWLDAAKASRAVATSSLVLGAMDRLMMVGPDPSHDEATFRALTDLACAVAWRAEDPSRPWLLAKFDQPAVGADDLHVVTRALATRSGAPGVDVTMVLGINAREEERSSMRARYASVWAASPTASRAARHEAWLAAAKRELEWPQADTVAGRAVRAVAMARLSRGAHLLLASASDEARMLAAAAEVELLLLNPDAGLERRAAALATVAEPATLSRESTPWAVRFVAAQQRIPDRLQLLGEFTSAPTLPEARLLVETAFRGSPERVQNEAQAVLKRQRSQAVVAAAMLEFAPFIPPSTRNADIVLSMTSAGSLPSPRHPSWAVSVRRALVERMLELLSRDGIDAFADAVGSSLADAYAGRLSAPGGTPPMLPAEAAVERVVTAAIRDARALIPTGREPLSLVAIVRSKEARERMAAGRLQLFAARQATLAEVMAYAASCDMPGKTDRVVAVLAAHVEARRRAVHVLDQIASAERLMLELWVMRLDDGEPGGAS